MNTLSIVTPAYNSIKYIQNCIDSVRHTCKDIEYEHIFADGGSNDGTWELLQKELADDPHLKLIPGPDNGMYDALNKAITLAQGPIISHLNTDEQLNPEGLHQCLDKFNENPELEAIFSPTIMLNSRLEFIQLYKQVVTPKIIDTYWCMPVQSCSLIYKKSVWERYPYNTQYRLAADHDWFRKQMEMGLNIGRSQTPIGIFVWSPYNLSNTTGQTSPEDALADIDKKSFRIKLAKHWYRLKKLLLGGYYSTPVTYTYFNKGLKETNFVKKPALKVNTSRFLE